MTPSPDATIVSVFPLEVTEQKPGLNPQEFVIPAAAPNDISILHVGICHNIVYISDERGTMPVPELGSVVADAVVNDFLKGQLEYQAGRAHPGIFWVSGR